MTNSAKLIRLVKIMSLIDRRQGATLQHIVDECGVCPRTVYRDIEALAEGELTVFFDPQTHSYRFTEKVFLQPLTFSLEEATALVQVIQGLGKPNTPLRASLRQAQEKIMACLPQDRQKKVEEGRRAVDVRLVNQPAEVCRDIFGCVERAVRERRQLQARYYTKSREEWTERVLDPYVISFRGNAWYLVAYCYFRSKVMIFRLDRLGEASLLPTTFELPRNFSPDAFFAGSWFIEQGEPVKVRLRFAPAAARWVRDAHFHDSQRLAELPDGELMFEVTVQGTREITRWILGYGADVEVLDPPEVRRTVAAAARRMAGMYDGPGG